MIMKLFEVPQEIRRHQEFIANLFSLTFYCSIYPVSGIQLKYES
jgi:hypothetical protein